MTVWARLTAAGAAELVAACALSACGTTPTAGQKSAVRSILSTTTTTSTTTSLSSSSTTARTRRAR